MAYADTHFTQLKLREVLARPFVAFGGFMLRLAEANSMAQAANRIAEMSDDELADKGMTRAEAIQTLFAKYGHV